VSVNDDGVARQDRAQDWVSGGRMMDVVSIFWIGFFSVAAIHVLASNIVRAYRLKKRAQNIQAHGWPKPPMDADGDIVYPDAGEYENQEKTA
jgi:hypothetical protein